MATIITTFENIYNLIETDLPLFKTMYSEATFTVDELESIYNTINSLKTSVAPTPSTTISNTNT